MAQAMHTTTHLDQANCTTLVKCMLQLSINNIAYLRGLFPETAFHPTVLDTLDKLTVQFLQKGSEAPEEVLQLLNWFEQGVLQAVDKGYLKTLLFGVAEDADCTRLIEVYKFYFVYSTGGAVSMNIAGPQGETQLLQLNKDVGLADVQKQMIMLIRTSVMLCQTLSPLPDERYLFMKLLYHDNVPADYEPPHFRAATDAPAHFVSTPLQLYAGCVHTYACKKNKGRSHSALGTMQTPHSAAHVAVTSVCDRVMAATRSNSAEANCALAESLLRKLSHSCREGVAVDAMDASQDGCPSVNRPANDQAVVMLVADHVQQAGHTTVPDITVRGMWSHAGGVYAPCAHGQARYPELCVTDVEAALQELQERGTVHTTRNGIIAKDKASSGRRTRSGVFFCSQESQGMASGARKPPKASVVQEPVHQTKRRRVDPPKTRAARMGAMKGAVRVP